MTDNLFKLKSTAFILILIDFWQKTWMFQKLFLSLRRERWNQVEPRCAERWHLCDDELFDLAAWFHKHSVRYSSG